MARTWPVCRIEARSARPAAVASAVGRRRRWAPLARRHGAPARRAARRAPSAPRRRPPPRPSACRMFDRREHAQAALVDPLPAEPLDELDAHLFFEVLPVRFVGRGHRAGRPSRARLSATSADRSRRIDHRLQDDVAACHRALHADRRRVARWRLHQPGEQRGLRDVEFRRVLAEDTRATPPRCRTGRRRNTPCSDRARESAASCTSARCAPRGSAPGSSGAVSCRA